MLENKEKSTGDAHASARIFDAIIRDFYPTHTGSVQFTYFFVEVSLFVHDKLRQLRLKLEKLSCCAVQYPIESRP